MLTCTRCGKSVSSDEPRVRGFCPICWEKEVELTDESIRRADAVLRKLKEEGRR